MKIFLLLSIIIIISIPALSQDDRVPSQKQVQDQMKQAKKEAQQQITKMENEIAEAKKRGDDPESIQQMEKNLATLKKMLGVIDNVANVSQNKRSETISTTNTVEPYKSPYIKFYTQPVVTPTEAQAKDRLLWYRGKKINQNTLVTTKGRIIQYDRLNNRVLVQMNQKKDTNFLKVVNHLVKSRQWTQSYVNWKYAEKNSFFDYPSVMLAMERYDLIEKEYDKIVNNSLELPGTGTNPRAEIFYEPASNYGGPSVNSDNSIDPYVQEEYEYIKSLVNNPPPLDVTPPPKDDYSLCYYCDPTAQERYYREKEIWGTAFNEYEAAIISHVLTIERYYQLMGLDGDSEVGTMWTGELANAWKFATDRIEQKLKILEQRYADDIYRYAAVVCEMLDWERQKMLLGFANSDDFTTTEFIFFTNGKFERFIDDRIAANDYDVIFNYAVVLGYARQKALLGYINDDNDEYQSILEKIQKHNHFALTLNIDFDIQYEPEEGKPNLIANGHLSTAQKIYVSLGRTTDCKWQLYKYDPDYGSFATRQQETLFKIPLIVNNGIKQVLKNQTWITYPYSGPADLEMNFPIFKISLCPNSSSSDSALMDVIRYKQELTMSDAANAYSTDLLGYLDKVLVSVSDTKANQDEVIDLAGQMGTLSNQGTVDNPTGYAKLDEMQVKYKMNGVQHDLQKKGSEATKVGNTVILFDAKNGDQVLINSKTNTSHRDMDAIKLNSGLIQLKVVLEHL